MSRKHPNHRVLAGLCALAAAVTPTAALRAQSDAPHGQPLPTDRRAGGDAVSVADCERWLHMLAGAEFAGRGTGQDGYRKAAEYVAKHFAALGLEARGDDGGYFQEVPWTSTTIERAELVFEMSDGGKLTLGKDELTGSITDDEHWSGEVVLLNCAVEGSGRDLSVPGLDAIDIEDKVAIAVVRGDRRARVFGRFLVMRELQGKGATAVIFADEEASRGGLTGRNGMAQRAGNPAAAAERRRPLDLSFGGEPLKALLKSKELTFEGLDEAPVEIPIPAIANLKIEVKTEEVPAMNVWAVLPGSDPVLKDEYVVIGSHLDHLGRRGETVYPGADDDGSGTTGVMAVAQMFAKNGNRPKRSVLFVCFSGEERGLVGSRYFADNCPIELSAIAAELQMDMIGRDEEEAMDGRRRVNVGETAEENRNSLHLVGTEKLAPALHELCVARNEHAGFELEYDQESLFGRSDHYNFAKHGVPIAFFFTGLHMDYHQPTDTPDKINYPKLLRVARYVYDIGYQLAAQTERPTIDRALWAEFRKPQGRRGGRSNIPQKPAAPMSGEEPADDGAREGGGQDGARR